MYEKFFNLARKPFDLLPNPDFLFPSASHKRALTFLEYGIRDGSGFILLTGEVGSGKTTLIRNLLKQKPAAVVLSRVFNTNVDAEQLVALVNEDFGLPVTGRRKIDLLRDLNDFLIQQYAAGRQAVIVVDEAQNLTPEALEEVRLISNLETDSAKLVQVIMVGQPELKKTLARPGLLQLRQRISISCHLKPLTPEETEQYILYRLDKAGNREAVAFAPGAMPLIHTSTRGIPRLVNIVCDYLMLSAFASQSRDIDRERVQEIIDDLDFETRFWACDDGTGLGESPETGGRISSVPELESLLSQVEKRLAGLELSAPAGSQDMLLDAVERIAALERTVGQRLRDMAASLQALERKVAAATVDGPASGNGEPGPRRDVPPAPQPTQGTPRDTVPEAPGAPTPEPATVPAEPAAADSSNAPAGTGLLRRIFNSLNS